MDSPKLPLSLVIITKNEEENIQACISSVPFADEVIVVDAESVDSTVQISEALGAKVISQKWLGFQKQKQLATDLASNDWVLNLDADERLSSELQKEILDLFSEGHLKENAFSIPRLSYHLGRWIRHGGWYPDLQNRLYNKKFASWKGGDLHEYLDAKIFGRLKSPIHHYVFKSLSHQVVTNDRYSTLGAEKLMSKGSKFTFPFMIIKPWVKFFECYVYKLGFLDGRAGFVIAVGAAYSMFLKYAKLWESQIEKH